MKHLFDYFKKNEELILYIFFGFITVVVNTLLFMFLNKIFNTFLSNTLAFFISVVLAYITNTLFVFKDILTIKNFIQFVSMRFLTLFIDNSGVILLINLKVKPLISKIIINIIIIIINYLISKFIIFKKKYKE